MLIEGNKVTKIGAGQFTTAYRIDGTDRIYLLTKTDKDTANNNIKEIYTHILAKHVPYVSTVDTEVYMPRVGYVNIYESVFYDTLSVHHQQAWRDAKILQQAWKRILNESTDLLEDIDMRYVICDNFINYLRDNTLVSDELIHALNMIYTWATCYGPNFLFEFDKRNLKVDSHGDLILLDIVFYWVKKNRW